jgi:hypothetical protein
MVEITKKDLAKLRLAVEKAFTAIEKVDELVDELDEEEE